jgi:hypothetical protein
MKKAIEQMHDGLGVGWKIGFEPTTSGTTIQRSNQLSYIHRLGLQIYKIFKSQAWIQGLIFFTGPLSLFS